MCVWPQTSFLRNHGRVRRCRSTMPYYTGSRVLHGQHEGKPVSPARAWVALGLCHTRTVARVAWLARGIIVIMPHEVQCIALLSAVTKRYRGMCRAAGGSAAHHSRARTLVHPLTMYHETTGWRPHVHLFPCVPAHARHALSTQEPVVAHPGVLPPVPGPDRRYFVFFCPSAVSSAVCTPAT